MDEKIDKLIELGGTRNLYQYILLSISFICWTNNMMTAITLPFLEQVPDIEYIDPTTGDTIQSRLNYTVCGWDSSNYTITKSYEYSWVIETDIVCDAVKTGFIGSVIFIGDFCGSIIFNIIVDTFGRRKTFLFGSLMFVICNTALFFFKNYYEILVFTFFINFFCIFTNYSTLLLTEENSAVSIRGIFGTIINSGFPATALIYFPLFIYLKKWQYVFIVTSSVAFAMMLMFWIFAKESPRFYISKGDVTNALKVIRNIAGFHNKLKEYEEMIQTEEYVRIIDEITQEATGNKKFANIGNPNEVLNSTVNHKSLAFDNSLDINKALNFTNVTLNSELNQNHSKGNEKNGEIDQNKNSENFKINPEIDTIPEQYTGNKKYIKPKINACALVKYPSIRYKFLILCYLGFCISGSYNGVSISIKNLPGDIFTNGMLFYSFEVFVGFISGCLINSRLGRKGTILSLYFISFVSFVLFLFFSKNPTVKIIIVLFLKFSISGIFSIMYTYFLENYPTVIRALGFGINTSFDNFGGSVFPLITEIVPEKTLFLILGIMNLSQFILMLFMPETNGIVLPETIKEIEDEKMLNDSILSSSLIPKSISTTTLGQESKV